MAYDDPTMTTAHTGIILVGYSVTYTLAGVVLGRLNKKMSLQSIYFWGLVVMAAGFVALALSPTFVWKVASIALYGLGTGFMASSMNSYMAKNFTARHNNLMHFFWGIGAAISPLIMGQVMTAFNWRVGYFVITGLLGIAAVLIAWSFGRKMWINDTDTTAAVLDHTTTPTTTTSTTATSTTATATASASSTSTTPDTRYLTKKSHQTLEVLTFFFLGGTDYTIVFFTGAALIARGHYASDVLLFPAVYYAFMTIGRLVAGVVTRWLHESAVIRLSIAVALAGITTLFATGSIIGMAITGLGLAPLLPTLVSDSSHRFAPAILPKLVGREIAAFGAGIAAPFFLTSQVLHFISYEALFPLAASFAIAVFICNEILERAMRKQGITRPE